MPPPDETGGLPPPTTGEPGDESDASTSTSGLPECSGVLACESGFVCVYGQCSHAWNHSFELRVLDFWPATCENSEGELVDTNYFVWRGADVIGDSPVDDCHGEWPDTVTVLGPAEPERQRVMVDFWDNDLLSLTERLCILGWDSLGNGDFGPIPAAVLADGYWSGTFDEGCYAELEFTLAE